MKCLGVPNIGNGTGKSQAEAVINLLNEWKITDKVKLMCFDTTASNTGVRNGACKIIKDKIGHPILGLACRHHIMEVVVSKVFKLTVEKTTCGPEIALFQKFKSSWKNVNQNNFEQGLTDDIISEKLTYIQTDILTFINNQLKETQPRGDYEEFLELAVIFLGGYIPNYKFKPPGALHRARWMAKIIYCIKIFLFRFEISLAENVINNIRNFLIFIFKIYLKHWFMAPYAASAPQNDLNLYKMIDSYKIDDENISHETKKTFSRHLWYLNEELAGLAFFDDDVDENIKLQMVKNMLTKNGNGNDVRFDPATNILNKELPDFVTQNTKHFFEALNLNEEFLNHHPNKWNSNTSYIENKKTVFQSVKLAII